MDISSLMDQLGELIKNFDPDNFMPDINSMLGKVELIARIAVLAGPVLLLTLGLLYFLLPPKEANHAFGYRFYWGMGSVESWQFSQKLAGIVWGLLGLILTIIMALICNGYRSMDAMDIIWSAAECLLWQMVLVAGSIILIDLVIVVCFDRKGISRFRKKDKRNRPRRRN